jgi:hypothetical protein
MPNDLQKDKNLVPTRIAARESRYTTDYITLLAREGKIFATKIGRQWHVDLDEVLQFAYRQDKAELTRQAELKALRKIEYALYAKNVAREIALRVDAGRERALVMAVCVVLLAFATGTAGYFSTNKEQLASLQRIDVSLLENTAVALYEFITPTEWYAIFSGESRDELQDSVQRSRSYNLTSVPSIEDEQAIIRDAFSDKLEVVFDAEVNDSGVIVPEFKDQQNSKYRFRLFLEEMVQGSS